MAELEASRQAEFERDAHRQAANQKHAANWFWRDFYRHHWIRNPDTGYNQPRLIIDPDRPLPQITEWEFEGASSHASCFFTCEGFRFACRWRYSGGGDRAYWDDGWWPDWFLVRRRRWLPFLTYETQVHGAQGLARELEL